MVCRLTLVCKYMDISCVYTKRYPEAHNNGCYALVFNPGRVVVAKTTLLPVKGLVPAPTVWILWPPLTPWLLLR